MEGVKKEKKTSSELPITGWVSTNTDGCFVPSSVLGNRGTKMDTT